MARRAMTAEEAAASRKRRARHLEDAVRALLSSEGWARWVRVRSRNGLSRYSWFNQVQIAAQRPGASYVCGRGDWRRLGYELADQEWRHPIWIVAPFTDKRTEKVRKETTGETEIERRYRYFRAVKVYDRAQVRPIDGAEPVDLRRPARPLTGDSHAHLLAPLCALAQSLGYQVTARDLEAGGAQGWCDPVRREIVVNRQHPANARVRILVHEIAHAHPAGKLDYQHFTRQQAEVLVDTVTYVVCGQVGLDLEGESIPYVAGWGEAGALEAVHTFAATVDAVAGAIEAAIAPAHDQATAVSCPVSERVGSRPSPEGRPARWPEPRRAYRHPNPRGGPMAASDRPTAKQLRYLRALADQTGTTFTPPTTRGEASQAIDALGRRPVEARSDRRRQRRQVSVDLTEAWPDSSVRGDEVSGYGGGARWR